MKTILKQKLLRTVLGGMGALMLLSAPNAFAIFPTSGICAMLVTPPVPVGATVPLNDTYNVLAMITFTSATTGTIDFFAEGVRYTSGGVEHCPGCDELASAPVVIAGGQLPSPASPSPNSKTLSFIKPGDVDPITMNAFSVNGDRTILMQGTSSPFSGVCQF